MSHANDIQALVGRTEKLVTSIAEAILSASETAAERIEVAAEVCRIQQRLAAFGAVVDAIAAQKRALVERLATAEGPAKVLIGRQIELLGLQELAVLERAGGAARDRPARTRGGGRGAGGASANGRWRGPDLPAGRKEVRSGRGRHRHEPQRVEGRKRVTRGWFAWNAASRSGRR